MIVEVFDNGARSCITGISHLGQILAGFPQATIRPKNPEEYHLSWCSEVALDTWGICGKGLES